MKLITAFVFLMLTLPVMAQQYTIENNEVKMDKVISFKPGTDKLEASSGCQGRGEKLHSRCQRKFICSL